MKDKNARRDIEYIIDRLRKEEDTTYNFINRFDNITIKECNKCKHETVQLKKFDINLCTDENISYYQAHSETQYFLCTVCGSTTTCETETVCKPYIVKGA